MILEALEQCYEVMANDDKFDIAPKGYSRMMCGFAIVIDKEGSLVGIYDLRDGKKGEMHIVPLQAGRSGKNPPPYFCCDKSKYFLGYEYDNKSKQLVSYPNQLEAAHELHNDVLGELQNIAAKAIIKFLERTLNGEKWDIMPEHDIYKGGLILFKLQDKEGYIQNEHEIKVEWEKYLNRVNDENTDKLFGQCLITGKENVPLARIHTLVKGIMGTNATGGSIVGFNFDSVLSYDKKQSYNAPVAEETMFKYTTALNSLLASNQNRMIIGDTTCAFWSEKEVCGNCTKVLMSLFSGEIAEQEKQVKQSSSDTKQTKDILTRVRYGMDITSEMIEKDEKTKVYILGLAPNMARVSIRFWYEDTFGHFIEKIRRHFKDLELIKSPKDQSNHSIRDIVKSLAVGGKVENVPKTMENALFTAITTGGNYPQGIYTHILIRIRAEAGDDWCISYTRVAFIKAYLKRKFRINQFIKKEEEVTVALNKESSSKAYQLGRLFAVLEKLQQDAGNKGLRERYFASASTTPKVVFPAMLKLAQSHVAKIGKNEGNVYMDKVCEEILAHIDEFPTSLNLDDQGMFILGYYHQRQYIYTKKEDK